MEVKDPVSVILISSRSNGERRINMNKKRRRGIAESSEKRSNGKKGPEEGDHTTGGITMKGSYQKDISSLCIRVRTGPIRRS